MKFLIVALFTLRSYTFNSTDQTFILTTTYFGDAFCTKPSFVLSAEGTYLPGDRHRMMCNTRTYELR